MKQFNPKKYGDFSRGEIIAVIQMSAGMLSNKEIKDKFFELTEKQKRITNEQILEIQTDFSTLIANKSKEYLKNIEGNPLSHPRLILDYILDIYKESRKKTPISSVRVADNEYEIVEKEDLKMALAALKLATDYLHNIEKIKIEKNKKSPVTEPTPDSVPTEWELDTGFNSNEQ